MGFLKRLFGGDENPKAKQSAPDEFKNFLASSMEGLRVQTSAHQNTWGLGRSERWDFSQDTGQIIFTFADKIATAPAQIIGTFDGEAKTWLWAWANPSLAQPLTKDALQVRAYGQAHGIERLIAPEWSAKETDCWEMTALASRLCESNGAYRGPAGSGFVFFTFGKIEINKR